MSLSEQEYMGNWELPIKGVKHIDPEYENKKRFMDTLLKQCEKKEDTAIILSIVADIQKLKEISIKF